MAPLDEENPPNDSGQPDAVLPPELRGFSWGGFLGSWVWAAGNGVWVGLLGLVPGVGFFIRILLGVKGSRWAWQSKKWASVQNFDEAQRIWAFVGIGFSLFSLLLSAAIVLPVIDRARNNRPPSGRCSSKLKLISIGLLQYTQDYNGKCPPGNTVDSWKAALASYLKSDALYHCPSDANEGVSYGLNTKMAGTNLERISDPPLIPVLFDSAPRHLNGSYVAFADGHVKWFDKSQWGSKVAPQIDAFVPDRNPSQR